MLERVLKNFKVRISVFCKLNSACNFGLDMGKASVDNLSIEYNDLEDYEEKGLTIIAKLEIRRYYKDTPLQVFDIYKDFLGLNRAIRKQIKNNNKSEFESIDIEENHLGLELLAIY